MKSLFWLGYRRNNTLLGVVIVEARALLEARMLAAIDGLDQFADFSEGYEVNAQYGAMVPTNLVGRMLSPGEVAWIESEATRKGIQIAA